MEQTTILYPLFGLVAWTFIMAVVMISRAFRAVGEGLNREYFRHGQGYEPPGYMLSAYQHFNNLFEMPVLFYVGIITIYVTAVNDVTLLILAWCYVLSRIVHSRYHLSNTHVSRRRNAFIVSFLILLGLWLVTVSRVMASSLA